MRNRVWLVVVGAVVCLTMTGCEYFLQAYQAQQNGTPVPWMCDPTAPNSVTGPGMGTVDFYAGETRAPLNNVDCNRVALQMDAAKAYAEQYPTAADAEADGFISTFGFIPGMGTHHGKGAITPEMLVDPDFDLDDPVIPDSIIDDVFDPTTPEFLQYNGDGPDAVLVGMSYYVRTDTGLPPEGFVGGNDWWHHHPSLCFDPATAEAFAVNTTDQSCATRGGINVEMDDYYMLHVWLVDDLEYVADVHAPTHPCITGSGAIFDMDHPCHGSAGGSGVASLAAGSDERGTGPTFFCPIGLLAVED